MNSLSPIKYMLLIAILLVSQVGSAYVSMSAMQDCGMDMPTDVEAKGADASDSMHTMQMMSESMNDSSTEAMDCCDMDMTSRSVTTCCDVQCQCSSFVTSIFLSSEKPLGSASYQADNVVIHRITALHTPFIQQPKRPPISKFS